MKLLLLGGTRLLGLSLLKRLSGAGFDVTVLSRRVIGGLPGVTFLSGEKSETIGRVSGTEFDAVIDFISYGQEDITENYEKLTFGRYYFISSVWLTKMAPGLSPDEPVTRVDEEELRKLPALTRRYVTGKRDVENFIAAKNRDEKRFNSIRLPIFLGRNDHTRRIHFFIERVMDEFGVFLVDGGLNHVQIAWVEDLADVLFGFVKEGGDDYLIWEGVPEKTIRVAEIYRYLDEALGRENRYVSKQQDWFRKNFPEYLDHDPLWRERTYKPTGHNLFSFNDRNSTDYRRWLGEAALGITANERDKESGPTDIRKKEIEHLRSL